MKKADMFDRLYMHGLENRGIRYYYYVNNGLSILNQFRNLVLGIFALYVVLKLENPFIMVVMFVVSVPILAAVGYFEIHRMSKVMEWIGLRFSSHYAIRQFNYNQAQYEELVKIHATLQGYGSPKKGTNKRRGTRPSRLAKRH